jgi:hypothetical protein
LPASHEIRHAPAKFGNRTHPKKIYLVQGEPVGQKVQVCIGKARDHRKAGGIDDLCSRSNVVPDFIFTPYRHNALAFNGHRLSLRPLRY